MTESIDQKVARLIPLLHSYGTTCFSAGNYLEKPHLQEHALEMADAVVAALRTELSAPAVQGELLQCDVTARPLEYPLSDHHKAPSEGPLNAMWVDKPHRLLYDLIAAVKWYTTPQPAIAQPKQDNYDSLINSVKMQSAAQAGLVAGQEYDNVTRESAENAIEYMSSYNGRGREVDAQAMLVTTPPPPSIGGEVTDAEIGRIANSYGVDSIQGFDHIKAFARAIIAATSTKPVALEPLQDAKPADSAAVEAEPVLYSVTFNGQHTDNIFHSLRAAEITLERLNKTFPNDVRSIVRLYTAPQAPTAQPVALGWQLVHAPVNHEEVARACFLAPLTGSVVLKEVLIDFLRNRSAAPSMPPKEGV